MLTDNILPDLLDSQTYLAVLEEVLIRITPPMCPRFDITGGLNITGLQCIMAGRELVFRLDLSELRLDMVNLLHDFHNHLIFHALISSSRGP